MSIGNLATRLLKRLSRETTSGRFIPELDGLRFVAIGMVVLFHLNIYLIAKTSFYEHGGPAAQDWLCRAALVGRHGVELFFVISGFVLALPFAAHHLTQGPAVSLRAYYLRRLTRLEPPYFVTIFLLMGLGTLMYHTFALPLNGHLLASLFYLHNLIYGTQSTALGVAWSLEIEVQFYLLVPVLTLLFAIRDRWLRRSILCGSIVVSLALQALFLRGTPRLDLSIAAYLQFFLLGFLLADFFLIEWRSAPRHGLAWDAAALIGWPLLFYTLRFSTVAHWAFPALLFVLYCAVFRGWVSNRMLSNPWITAIGGMCYSIYLVHYEVISAVGRFTKHVGQWLPNPVYLLLQLAMVGSAIVVVCGLYFVMLEKPCMRRDWPRRARAWIADHLPLREPEAEPAEAEITNLQSVGSD